MGRGRGKVLVMADAARVDLGCLSDLAAGKMGGCEGDSRKLLLGVWEGRSGRNSPMEGRVESVG